MARELSTRHHRIVVSGAKKPENIHIEFRVLDGELKEDPKREELQSINFGSSIFELFSDSIKYAETQEEIK